MFPSGFLGTRADILIDLVLVSFVIILPVLLISRSLARSRRYSTHKRIQISLFVVLTIVVAIFEYDMAASGGIFEMTKGSAYEGTTVLLASVYIHTTFAVLTSLIWILLVAISLFKFPTPPEPNAFSTTHRFWGRIGMITMIAAGLTAIPLYYFGFVA